MFKRLFGKRGDEPTAAKHEGDVTMAGPDGAPVPDESVEERRERDRPDDSAA